MQNLVLTRIDDRLIHGQVMTAWIKRTNAEQVVVVDDQVAKDDFMINVLENAIPENIAIGIFSKEDAVKFFSEPLEAPTILLVKTPQTLKYLIDNGINIKEIDLGGMGARNDRQTLFRYISTNDEEDQTFLYLLDKGINVFVQIMPQQNRENIKDLIEKKHKKA